MSSRTIAIGDIHGHDRALEGLLIALAPESTDTLILLGDVVDRGPDSRRCLEILLTLRELCTLILIKGNHEEMMLNALAGGEWADGWSMYGGRQTLRSYGSRLEIPDEHLDFLSAGLDYLEHGTEIFVHAGIDPQVPLDAQSPEVLRWEKFDPFRGPPPGGKRVVCGHTVQGQGRPLVVEGWVCIDTGIYLPRGVLTALDVGTDTVLQSNQTGEILYVGPLDEIAEIV